MPLAFGRFTTGILTCFFGDGPFFGLRNIDPCATRFGQSDGDSLLGIAYAMFSLADLIDFGLDKFSGLRAP